MSYLDIKPHICLTFLLVLRALASPEALCPSSTFDFGRKPASATVTSAFPVVNVGDADLALGDARASDVPARDFLDMDAKYLLQ